MIRIYTGHELGVQRANQGTLLRKEQQPLISHTYYYVSPNKQGDKVILQGFFSWVCEAAGECLAIFSRKKKIVVEGNNPKDMIIVCSGNRRDEMVSDDEIRLRPGFYRALHADGSKRLYERRED